MIIGVFVGFNRNLRFFFNMPTPTPQPYPTYNSQYDLAAEYLIPANIADFLQRQDPDVEYHHLDRVKGWPNAHLISYTQQWRIHLVSSQRPRP